jgi:hypothetical protein
MSNPWPALPYDDWKDTLSTLHMWTQVVGKVKLALTPLVNHWWNVGFDVTPQGLTTGAMYTGGRALVATFNFVEHRLHLDCSDGRSVALPLRPISVAEFYAETMAALRSLDVDVRIWPVPVEIPDPIPFADDHGHNSYDPAAVERCHTVLQCMDRALNEFRSTFIGKSSPVLFFWGTFDLAVTRFSGRRAPEREGADSILREAMSHEEISCGFWPGDARFPQPALYAYAAPEPEGFAAARVRPASAFYSGELGEFVLPYEHLRQLADPGQGVLDFCHSTYAAGAELGGWDRAELERGPAAPVAATV